MRVTVLTTGGVALQVAQAFTTRPRVRYLSEFFWMHSEYYRTQPPTRSQSDHTGRVLFGNRVALFGMGRLFKQDRVHDSGSAQARQEHDHVLTTARPYTWLLQPHRRAYRL